MQEWFSLIPNPFPKGLPDLWHSKINLVGHAFKNPPAASTQEYQIVLQNI